MSEFVNKGEISDGYHTFNELYEHRNTLFVALCGAMDDVGLYEIWRSKTQSDGTKIEGYFLLGIHIKKGNQISYHLPMKFWDVTDFVETLDVAPEFDGHTSDDVLKRLLDNN